MAFTPMMPSGADFLSPALTEAELIASLLTEGDFVRWLGRFLPAIADGRPEALFTPVAVPSSLQWQLGHLHGLNLGRAYCWRRLADALPSSDPRIPLIYQAASQHAEPELAFAANGDFMVEHWLAGYAMLYLSGTARGQ